MTTPTETSRARPAGAPARSAARAICWLRSVDARLLSAPCPVCGGTERRVLMRRDRYFLKVDIAVCSECGCVHCSRHFDQLDEETFYAWVYPALMGKRGATPTTEDGAAAARSVYRLRRMRSVIGPLGDILEIGSGFGHFLAACADEGIGALHGIEPGARSSGGERTPGGIVDAIDATPLHHAAPPPFTPKIVVMFHVLEHFADPTAALSRVADWIAPDGWLVVEVPDILGNWGRLGVQNFHVSHRSYFSADSLSRLLHQAGFHSVVIEREEDDFIYPGNLRIFARRRDGVDPASRANPDVEFIRRRIQRLAPPWSFRNGYPRSMIRLVRLALGMNKPPP